MEQEEKISFINKFRISIFKLENYGLFLIEKVWTSFKYLILLVFLVSIIMSLLLTYDRYNKIQRAYNYINNELPDFTYSDGKLSFENYVEGYDERYNFKIIIDTKDLEEKKINEYKNKIFGDDTGILVLNDRIVYLTGLTESSILYKDINFKIYDKESLINQINTIGLYSILVSMIISDFISFVIYNMLFTLMAVLVVASVGYMASFICKIKIRYSSVTTLAIYSLTLSIVLKGIYEVVNVYTGFVIRNFDKMYLFIAFIYIIASMFMIKSDLVKQNLELQKILEVQKNVKEEEQQEEQEDDNKEDEEKDKKPENNEDDNSEKPNVDNREPDGSEI